MEEFFFCLDNLRVKVGQDKKLKSIRNILADNVLNLRKKKGLTQEQLAEKADISKLTLQRVEYAQNWPKALHIKKIAQALGVQEHELFQVENLDEVVAKIVSSEIMKQDLPPMRNHPEFREILKLLDQIPEEKLYLARVALTGVVAALRQRDR